MDIEFVGSLFGYSPDLTPKHSLFPFRPSFLSLSSSFPHLLTARADVLTVCHGGGKTKSSITTRITKNADTPATSAAQPKHTHQEPNLYLSTNAHHTLK